MSRTYRSILAATALAAVGACGRGDRADIATADSLNRDLQLAPVDSSAPLNDQPAADTAAAASAPAERPAATPAPKRKPKPRPTTTASRPAPAPAPSPAPSASAASA